MRIAVPFAEGEIFQHFGKTETFKVYEVEENKIVSCDLVDSNGSGHGALAGLLADQKIDLLICGGIGGGAQAALEEAGIELCAGATGDADEAVAAYLNGELENAGVTCDHHDHDEEEGCGGNCGSACGGGCPGCRPSIEGKNVGKNVRVHYRGTFNDGTEFDSSYGRGQTLDFVCGAGMMIRGFDVAVANMEVGEEVDVHLMPEEAYGVADPNMIFNIEVAQLPGSENLQVGQRVQLINPMGQPFPVTVTAREGETITFDANHEMAGKELNFHIELVEIQ